MKTEEDTLETWTAEVERRGGETSVTGLYSTARLAVTDESGGLVLLHCAGFRAYSRRHGCHRAALSYLCGREDGQLWAVRVPGTLTSVRAALAWLEPADVAKARLAGKRVLRQGDVYAVQTTRAHDGKGAGGLPERHSWDPAARTLYHPEHGDLAVPFPARFVPQRVYGMGRGAGMADGD